VSGGEGLLFYGKELRIVLDGRKRDALAEVDSLDPDRLLGMIPNDLVDYLVEKYGCEELSVDDGGVEVDILDSRTDVRWEPGRDVWRASGPVYVSATVAEFHIPYTGDAELLGCQASRYTMNPPRGVVAGEEITISVDASRQDADSARSAFANALARIKEHMAWANADAAAHNAKLRPLVSARVESRRQKLLGDRGLAQSLGFPIRSREGKGSIPQPPLKRKRIVGPPPTSTRGSFRPEPALADQDYEDILHIVLSMVDVMERSPHAFRTMGEEDLRQHFLVQLNGHYEGDATGETFNFEGKTDILVRRDGGNVFVGECKFWRGPKEFAAATDQLLGYVTWRDTKAALLVFNRNRSMTAVLHKVKAALEAHSHFKRFEPYASETGFRCHIAQKNDSAREVLLTVLVFHVPGEAIEQGNPSE